MPPARPAIVPAPVAHHARDARILLAAGIAVAALALGFYFAYLLPFHPRIAGAVAVQAAAHLAVGKDTGIPTGLAAGVPPPLSAVYAFAQDSIVFLLGFPLVLLFETRLSSVPLVARWLERVRVRAESRSKGADRLGYFALTVPVWVPFVPTGALTAGVLGLALGYPPRRVAPLLLACIAASCTTYALGFGYVFARFGGGDVRFAVAIVVAVAALAFGIGYLASRVRRKAPL